LRNEFIFVYLLKHHKRIENIGENKSKKD
jgi:hypothetical protein